MNGSCAGHTRRNACSSTYTATGKRQTMTDASGTPASLDHGRSPQKRACRERAILTTSGEPAIDDLEYANGVRPRTHMTP